MSYYAGHSIIYIMTWPVCNSFLYNKPIRGYHEKKLQFLLHEAVQDILIPDWWILVVLKYQKCCHIAITILDLMKPLQYKSSTGAGYNHLLCHNCVISHLLYPSNIAFPCENKVDFLRKLHPDIREKVLNVMSTSQDSNMAVLRSTAFAVKTISVLMWESWHFIV